jgi:hypothetical protein
MICTSQVGDCARQFENAVVSTRRELKLGHGAFHQRPPGIIQLAELANFSRAHIRIAGQGNILEAVALPIPGSFNPLPDNAGRFSQTIIA